jgi:dihydrofolate reductase
MVSLQDQMTIFLGFSDTTMWITDSTSSSPALAQSSKQARYELRKHGWETHTSTFVLSHHLTQRKPQRDDVVFTDEDISEVLKKAKQLTSKDVWIEGGANVAQQFMDRELIDEIVLSIVPVVLGDGIRLFGKTHKPIDSCSAK